VARKVNATWVIPSTNEWYKAAYYNPLRAVTINTRQAATRALDVIWAMYQETTPTIMLAAVRTPLTRHTSPRLSASFRTAKAPSHG